MGVFEELLDLAHAENAESWDQLRGRLEQLDVASRLEVDALALAHRLAADDMFFVMSAADVLLDETKSNETKAVVHASLRPLIDTGIVGTYARGYSGNRGVAPRLDAPRWLTAAHRELHARLLDLRNKLHAHTDQPHEGRELMTVAQARRRVADAVPPEARDAFEQSMAQLEDLLGDGNAYQTSFAFLTPDELREIKVLTTESWVRHGAVAAALRGQPYQFPM